jgi:ParB/RepB/Spo0J family partition protein
VSQPDTLRFLAIERLRPSPFNPRRTFAAEQLADLRSSINAVGILTPLIARPHPTEDGAYELAAGHRRFAVASEIGLPTVPVIVREYSDDELREVLIIENLQRADVHPLEEADALQALVDGGRTVGQIAERIGRDVRFVKRRLALRNLSPAARQLLADEKISLGVAQVLASASAEQQAEILNDLSWEIEEEDVGITVSDVTRALTGGAVQLSKAPWDLTDATLHKQAGACSVCPKRTGAQVELLPELGGDDRCLDRECYETKGAKHSARVLVELQRSHKRVLQIVKPNSEAAKAKAPDAIPSYGRVPSYGVNGWYPAKKDAPGAVPAVIRDGSDVGTVQWLTRTKPKASASAGASGSGFDQDEYNRKQKARDTTSAALKKALLAKLPMDLVKSSVILPLFRTRVYCQADLRKAPDVNGVLHALAADVIARVTTLYGDVKLAKDRDLVAVAKVLKVDLAPFQAQYDELVKPPAPKPAAKPAAKSKAKSGAKSSPSKAKTRKVPA